MDWKFPSYWAGGWVGPDRHDCDVAIENSVDLVRNLRTLQPATFYQPVSSLRDGAFRDTVATLRGALGEAGRRISRANAPPSSGA